MLRLRNGFVAALIFLATGITLQCAATASAHAQSTAAGASKILRAKRTWSSDLEVGGEMAGLPPGTTRYITRGDLLALSQVEYTVVDDSNFTGATEISGVSLEKLIRKLGAAPESDLVVAICDDKYRANYSRAYVAAHHPLLVLEVNGNPPSGWPKDSGGHGYDMGPYMISHPKFVPSFTVLSHVDEAQIPWGVVRLEFRSEKEVFGAIAPRGPHADESAVQTGYKIAQQNCYRCHNMGAEGGQKSGLSWQLLSTFAAGSPEFFAAYVRNPKATNPQAQMPGSPAYDDAIISALTAYFQTFSAKEKQ